MELNASSHYFYHFDTFCTGEMTVASPRALRLGKDNLEQRSRRAMKDVSNTPRCCTDDNHHASRHCIPLSVPFEPTRAGQQFHPVRSREGLNLLQSTGSPRGRRGEECEYARTYEMEIGGDTIIIAFGLIRCKTQNTM